jgi:hypothetical protein
MRIAVVDTRHRTAGRRVMLAAVGLVAAELVYPLTRRRRGLGLSEAPFSLLIRPSMQRS